MKSVAASVTSTAEKRVNAISVFKSRLSLINLRQGIATETIPRVERKDS